MDSNEMRDALGVERLFHKAMEQGKSQYLYTLVRIDGMQCYEGYQDEFIVLRDYLDKPSESDSLDRYRFLSSRPGPQDLLQNLLNCANGNHYDVAPFHSLKTGEYPNIWPTIPQRAEFLSANARASGFPELADCITAAYSAYGLDAQPMPVEQVDSPLRSLSDLMGQLLDRYFKQLIKFKDTSKYVKSQRSLDVLELIVDEHLGLTGIRVHFPENCSAEFIRSPRGAVCTNLEFGPPITFLKMSLEPSSNEYRVNGKRLCEIGLPGRYNKLGEWRPLIYPGDAHHLVDESLQLSKDPDVQGVLLYIRLTGHKCIEFAMKSNMELPGEYTATEKGDLYIRKCQADATAPDMRVYDCWINLETGTAEEIERRLASIGWFMNVLFFPYGATYSWRNKYRMTMGGAGLLTPTHEDLKTVDKILKTFPSTPDGYALGGGIDWYNIGTSSTNVFTRFLCYYVAFESVAVAIHDGAELGGPAKPNRAARKALAIDCINAKHAEMFGTDPIRFVEQSYFECVRSLKTKTKKVATETFGEGHPYVKLLFEKSVNGEMPLSDLRSKLAHGGITLLEKEHHSLVSRNLYEMGNIAREFLLRVLFGLKPSETVPSWSRRHQTSIITTDPRSTMWSTTDAVFPEGTSWKIRTEWCE